VFFVFLTFFVGTIAQLGRDLRGLVMTQVMLRSWKIISDVSMSELLIICFSYVSDAGINDYYFSVMSAL
jgi:hypothetical protein